MVINKAGQIYKLRRRIIALLIWNACFWTLIGWSFACGVLALIARILEWPTQPLWTVALGGLVIACTIAALIATRKRPSHESVAALLDARLAGGGLIMAGADDWPVPDETELAPRWDGRVPALFLLAGVSFLLLAAKVPLKRDLPFVDLPIQMESVVERLEEQISTLEEVEFIEEEQAREWSELVRALRQDSSGLDPAATWEALDQLSDRIEDETAVEVDTRRVEVEKREELIAALKAALQAYEENRGQADAAMKELSELLNAAAQQNPNLQALLESLPEFGVQQVVGSCLSPEEARLLAERLSKMTAADLERMRKLLEQGMCQSGACQRPGGEEALKKFLAENPGCTNLAVCAGMTPCGGWDVNRGPGSAPISWLGETSEEGVDFTEQKLTSAQVDSLADSELVGESYSAPEVDGAASGSSGGVLTGQEAGDSAATVHTVLPRHRETVDQFFKRNEGK